MTTGVTGTLAVANGGTGNTSFTASNIITGNGTSALSSITPASGVLTFLQTPSSANLRAAITDETGTGALVFAQGPTFVAPVLGAATATSLNGAFINYASNNYRIASFSGSMPTGGYNFALGGAGIITTGTGNTAVGVGAGTLIGSGSSNTPLGSNALSTCQTGSENVAIGAAALNAVTGSGNIGLGTYAGQNHTGSNIFIVDNQSRASIAAEVANAILVGTMASAAASQTLIVNAGTFIINGTVTSGTWNGATVGAAFGGTGKATLTANNVILGNGTSPVQFVAPGTSGNLLTSDGTTWTSAAAPAGGDKTLRVLAAEMIPRTTTGCGVNSSETSTNKVNYDSLDFDTTTQEFAQFIVILPSNYTTAATVTAKFLWTADSGSGGVVWALAARALSDDDALDTAMGTAQQVADTLLAAGDMHISGATSAITIAGSPASGVPVVFEVKRVPSDGSDTLAVDPRLIGVIVTYT